MFHKISLKIYKRLVREIIVMPKKYIFIKILTIYPFIDDYYEDRSYERGVAQLGSAGDFAIN